MSETKRTYMKDLVTIGQVWLRKRDQVKATVRQVHRADRQVLLTIGNVEERVSFATLKSKYRLEDPDA